MKAERGDVKQRGGAAEGASDDQRTAGGHIAVRSRKVIAPTEAEFLRNYRPADFARPSVTVDIAAFSVIDAELRVLLIRRGEHPFKGAWRFLGASCASATGIETRVRTWTRRQRGAEEETALKPGPVYLEQLGAFGCARRDPRMRVITVAYFALIRTDLVPLVKAGGDAAAAEWVHVGALTPRDLAFDHHEIIRQAVARIPERIDSTNIARSLVPKTFTIPELRHVHALLSGRTQDPGNFRRRFQRLLEDGIIEQAPGKRSPLPSQPPSTASHPAKTQGGRHERASASRVDAHPRRAKRGGRLTWTSSSPRESRAEPPCPRGRRRRGPSTSTRAFRFYGRLRRMGIEAFLANLSFTYLSGSNARQVTRALYSVDAETGGGDDYFPERALARFLSRRGDHATVYTFDKLGVAGSGKDTST